MIKPGLWQSSSKNLFWINTVENKVFWLGMNKPSENETLGENWSHVGHGLIDGNKLVLEWADIPAGKDKLNGTITIEIISPSRMKVIENSGYFGLSEWSWQQEMLHFNQVNEILQAPSSNDIT